MNGLRMAPLLLISLMLFAGSCGCLTDDFTSEPFYTVELYSGTLEGGETFNVPERSTHLGIEFDATVAFTVARETGGFIGISINLTSPSGKGYDYEFSESGTLADSIPLPEEGEWTISVIDYTGQNSVDARIDVETPKYDDWAWYKFWLD